MTLSGQGRRSKGVRGEREVSKLFEAHGYDVRGLEGQGDHIAVRGSNGALLGFHLECKRQERVKIPEWWRQCEREAPEGMTPLLAFRQNGTKWLAVLPVEALLDLLDRVT